MASWRRRGLDVGIVMLSVAILLSAFSGTGSIRTEPSVIVSAAALLIFLARRWQPLVVTVIAFGALALGATFVSTINSAQFFGILVTFALAGLVNRPPQAVIAWVPGMLAVAYASSRQPVGGRLADFGLTAAFCTTIWAAGVAVAYRGRRAVSAEERANEAERTRAEQVVRATSEERARLARELHDIVSHGLTVVIVQTVAARQALSDVVQPAEVTGSIQRRLSSVEEAAREALLDMRRMLGLLQQIGLSDAAVEPSPALDQLPQLVERARMSGIEVELRAADDMPAMSAAMELAVYRIVQESLTNAIKHAPGAAAVVSLCQSEALASGPELQIEVITGPGSRSPGSSEGAGRGLIGLQQRCELFGGSCQAAPTADGGFRLCARLPLAVNDLESAS